MPQKVGLPLVSLRFGSDSLLRDRYLTVIAWIVQVLVVPILCGAMVRHYTSPYSTVCLAV